MPEEQLCPFCAEPIGLDAGKCRSCGERLGDVDGSVGRGSSKTLLLVLCVAVGVLALVFCVLPMFLFKIGVTPTPPGGPPLKVGGPLAPPNLPPDPGQATTQQVQRLSLETAWASTQQGGRTTVPCKFYSWGGYAIVDMGNLRLAVRGVRFAGHGVTEVAIMKTPSAGGAGGTSSSIGPHSLTISGQGSKGVTGSFDQVQFKIHDGILTFNNSGVQVDLQGTPQVVVVDADGSNAKVLPYTGP